METVFQEKTLQPDKNILKVMSYNVLAFGATKHHFKSKTPETIEHRDKRHSVIINTLKNSKCDVILLQEMDYTLYIKLKATLWNEYEIFFSVKIDNENQLNDVFGTSIMFSKTSFFKYMNYTYIYDDDKTKFGGKNATILELWHKHTNEKLTFISIHLCGQITTNNNENICAKNLLKNIGEVIYDRKYKNIIFGGDFNSQLIQENLNNEIIQKIMKESVTMNNLINKDFNFPEFEKAYLTNNNNNNTTCHFDYDPSKNPAEIDHIFYDKNKYKLENFEYKNVNCNNKADTEIWLVSDVLNASDHFPIIATFEIKTNTTQDGGNKKKYKLKKI